MNDQHDDYFGTAIRMQKDSSILHNNKCWHNACYLAGYVVEAGLKAIIHADRKGKEFYNPKELHTHDLNELDKLVTATRLFSGKRKPFDTSKIAKSELFKQWNPGGRYKPKLWNNESISQEFQNCSEHMKKELYIAMLN